MTQTITNQTGTITIPTNNTIHYIDHNSGRVVAEHFSARCGRLIVVTDMDGEMNLYFANKRARILVNNDDVVNRGAVLAQVDS